MKKNITRRDFLKGTAAGAVGVMAAGLLGACSSESGTTTAAPAPETTAAPVPETTVAPAEPVVEEIRYDENRVSLLQDWLGQAPEFDHIDEEVEADVIVCGGGLAGVSAAREAAENGATVIVFEK